MATERRVYDDLDVVVVNYQTPKELRNFLYSYRQYRPLGQTALWVVNVCPRPEDLAVIQELTILLPEMRHIVCEENVGYGRACNLAASKGHAPTIAMFNADTMLTDGLLEGCKTALWLDNSIGILGPRQYDERGRITHAGIFGSVDAPAHRGWNETDRSQYTDVVDAVYVSGSAFFAKRFCWEQLTDCPLYRKAEPNAIGAFLETPHYYNESYTCLHAKAHSYRVVYYGLLGMFHLWHRSTPVGGYGEQTMDACREQFRRACDMHGIEHE